MSNDYINNYKKITNLISSYKKKYNKDIKLVVVSKTQDFKKIVELHKNGQNDFGENYVDEAESKSNKLIIKQLNGILLVRFNQIKLKRFQSISHGYTLLIQKNM